jgi:Spy/CpxP family protein refolding chaperone
MKRQLISLLTGSLVLVASVVAILPVHADPLEMPMLSGIELSQEQEDQLAAARQQVRSQLEAITTPEQQQQFRAALEQGQGLRAAIAAMDLSSEQRTQVRQVFQASRSQFSEILTPEQRQQLRQNLRTQFGDNMNPEQRQQLRHNLRTQLMLENQ